MQAGHDVAVAVVDARDARHPVDGSAAELVGVLQEAVAGA
jgi:hypothetical protein